MILNPQQVTTLQTTLKQAPTSKGSAETVGFALMRSPGFEPGSSAWEADVLAKLDYDRNARQNLAEKT
jgi:hypothetical protein